MIVGPDEPHPQDGSRSKEVIAKSRNMDVIVDFPIEKDRNLFLSIGECNAYRIVIKAVNRSIQVV